MSPSAPRSPRLAAAALAIGACLVIFGPVGPAAAAVPTVGLGVIGDYAVLGGAAVTNTGPSQIGGNVGVAPGTAISGFDVPGGPGVVSDGTVLTPPASDAARAAAGTAYDDAAGRIGTPVADVELGGKTLVSGVYTAGSTGTFGLTGTLTLSGGPDDVWIFQTDSTLITAAQSSVVLSGGAQACNVFWKVGSSATLGASSVFAGTVLAAASVTVGSGAAVVGRLIAGTGAVTLINDVITRADCDELPTDADAAAAAADAALAEAQAAQTAAAEAAAAVVAAQAALDAAVAHAAAQVPGSPDAIAAEAAIVAAQLALDEAEARAEVASAAAAALQALADDAAELAAALVVPAGPQLAPTGTEPAIGIAALAITLILAGALLRRRVSRVS